MPRPRSPRPTDAELVILRALWQRGPSTVRELHDHLSAAPTEKPPAYTTVLTMLQVMTEKGLVSRSEEGRTHTYQALVNAEDTERHVARDLVDRLFGGSARKLVLHALSADGVSEKDLEEVRRLLDKIEGERK